MSGYHKIMWRLIKLSWNTFYISATTCHSESRKLAYLDRREKSQSFTLRDSSHSFGMTIMLRTQALLHLSAEYSIEPLKTINAALLAAVFSLFCTGFSIGEISPGQGVALAGELTPLYRGYPEVFDDTGSIDFIGKEKIIINDTVYILLPSTSFHSQNGFDSMSSFAQGYEIGLLVQDNNKAKSVWLIDARVKKVTNQDEESERKSRSGKLVKINGVWTN